MNPETLYTMKMRKLCKTLSDSVVIYKHSDRFNGGIADLHLALAPPKSTPLKKGLVVWVEVKWIPAIRARRNAGVTALQKEFLLEHAHKSIPAYVLIGTPHGSALYHITRFDGYLYRRDLRSHKEVCERLVNLNLMWLEAHG